MKSLKVLIVFAFVAFGLSSVAHANLHLDNPNSHTCGVVCDTADTMCPSPNGTVKKKDCTALYPNQTTSTCECSCVTHPCPSHAASIVEGVTIPENLVKGDQEVMGFCVDYLATHNNN